MIFTKDGRSHNGNAKRTDYNNWATAAAPGACYEACNPGYFGFAGHPTCQPCAGETRRRERGAHTCTSCPAGRMNKHGHDECAVQCPEGEFASSWTDSSCRIC